MGGNVPTGTDNVVIDGIVSVNSNADLTNNGTWSNYTTTLTGTTDQNLVFTQPFSGDEFFSSSGPGNGVAQSDLTFNGTKINFNFDTLSLLQGQSSATPTITLKIS